MINILSNLQRLIVCSTIEYRDWNTIRSYFNKEDFGKKCECKWYKNGKLKGDLCRHCAGIIDSIFEKIGYFGSDYTVIAIENPFKFIARKWFDLIFWIKYDVLKLPLWVFNSKMEKVNLNDRKVFK